MKQGLVSLVAAIACISLVAGPASAQNLVSQALLPGVELQTEEVEPGVFLVSGDGVRTVQGQQVAVSAEGDVWLLRGGRGDWKVVGLGEPGESISITPTGRSGQVFSLGLDASGAPTLDLTGGDRQDLVFDGAAWVKYQAPPSCYHAILMPDGACWAPRREDLPDQLGLSDDQYINGSAVGPDGDGWASLQAFDPSGQRGVFGGLLRYDGEAWTHIPYAPPDSPTLPAGIAVDMAVAADGTVWTVEQVTEGPDIGGYRVRSRDGTTWASYGPSDGPSSTNHEAYLPRTHFNTDGTIWFMEGSLYSDGESLHPFELDRVRVRRSPSAAGFAPDGKIWVVAPGRHLYVITAEAVTGKEAR